MLKLTHVTKRFGSVLALDDVTFTVPAGQIVGFLGPNGAGKSTCLGILTGLVTPDEGTATVGGVRYADLPNPAATVGSLLSTEGFHPSRSGLETLRMAALTLACRGSGWGRCWPRSDCRPRRPGVASAPTRWACGSDSGWPRRCSVTRRR